MTDVKKREGKAMDTLWAPWRMEYILRAKDEKPEPCIFCSRIEQHADKENLILHRSRHAFIIMNRFPYNNGHLMVVPYQHTGNILNLNREEGEDMLELIQLSVEALNRVMQPHGFNIGMNLGKVAGAGVDDHVHFHIVPRWNGDTNFMPVISDTKVVSEALDKTYNKIKEVLTTILKETK